MTQTEVTFSREYEGGYGVRVWRFGASRIVGYIDRPLDGDGWFDIKGGRHRYLNEAKAHSRNWASTATVDPENLPRREDWWRRADGDYPLNTETET